MDGMRNIDETTITQAVVASLANCNSPRLQTIVTSLVQHLHSFAREVRLTEDEWFAGINFLTEAGHITTEKRQEFILLSDTLGLSMLVMAQNNVRPAGCTESTVFGPFYVEGAPLMENGSDIANGALGEPCFVKGTVRGLDGAPVANALIDVWQSDANGMYDVQYPGDDTHRARARLQARADGSFDFRSVVAVPYPIPHDGPVGKMLERLGRHPWRPAHLHFMIEAPGCERLITHIFREESPYLDSDAVFGVRSSLVNEWVRHEPGQAPDGSTCAVPFYTLACEFVLHRTAAKVGTGKLELQS
jgi:hydroxyquinol 1,2-dioxygenase